MRKLITAVAAGVLVVALGAVTLLPRLWPSIVIAFVAAVASGLWPERNNIVACWFLAGSAVVFVLALRHRNAQLKAGAAS